jgi:hypothetical protein
MIKSGFDFSQRRSESPLAELPLRLHRRESFFSNYSLTHVAEDDQFAP